MAVAILIVLGALGVVLFLLAAREYFFLKKAGRVQGEVIEVTTFNGPGTRGLQYVPTIRYEVGGRVLTHRPASGTWMAYTEGQHLDVFYDPADPDRIVFARDRWLTALALFAPFALVFGWIAFLMRRRAASTLEKFSTLIDVQAVVTEVRPPGTGRNAWSVSAVWTDPATGQAFRFSSPFPFGKYQSHNRNLVALRERPGQGTVSVAFNPAKPEEYYMDISFPMRGSRP